MALRNAKNTHGAPYVGKVFAANAVAVLHDTDAPNGCKHLPAGVIFHGAGTFSWSDVDGTPVDTVVPATAAGLFVPIAPAALRNGGTSPAVTVFWFRDSKNC